MKTIDQPTPDVVIIDGQRYRLEKQTNLPTVQELSEAWKRLRSSIFHKVEDLAFSVNQFRKTERLQCGAEIGVILFGIKSDFGGREIRAKEPKGDGKTKYAVCSDGIFGFSLENCTAAIVVGAEYFSTQEGAELWREFMGEDLKHL